MTKHSDKELIKHVEEMREVLNLHEWKISISFIDGEFDSTAKTPCAIDVSIPYLTAHIRVFNSANDMPRKEIKYALTHELCHIFTEPLYSIALANVNPHLEPFVEEQREQVTERMARIVNKLSINL